MSTPCLIGIERPHGRVESVYCHWDGYPSGVGATLATHYASKAKAEEIIKGGSMSSLGHRYMTQDELDTIPMNERYDYAGKHDLTTTYKQWRNEDAPAMYHNLEEFVKFDDGTAYHYLFKDGGWWMYNGFDDYGVLM